MTGRESGHRVGPEDEYRRRIAVRQESLRIWARRDLAIAVLRAVAFFAAVAIVILAHYGRGGLSAWWSALPLAFFVALVVVHDVVINRRASVLAAVRYYERGLARIEDRWPGYAGAETGESFLDPAHPYAVDLDLFGSGSLYELLCSARTQAGAETLARWLKSPGDVTTIRERQEAVEELKHELDFRESLAIAGSRLRHALRPDALTSWAGEPPILFSRAVRFAAVLLPLFTACAALGWAFAGTGSGPFFAAVFGDWLIARFMRRRVQHITRTAEAEHAELRLLARVLEEIQDGPSFHAARLQVLRGGLQTDGLSPSRQVARMSRLLDLLDWQRNQFFAPVAVMLLWEVHLAVRLESWRARCGPSIPRWLSITGEFEALSSLAAYAYEHPKDRLPEIREDTTPCFIARALGHPLIPVSACVNNDVTLDAGRTCLLIVSGSNMSGKSTLLRTVGVNAVLAFAGAPVRAESLVVTPLSVGACIHLVDSLHARTSRFYAEIKRLRAISDLASGPFPVLFLLDEILHGTNSTDRLAGAEAVVRGFLQRGGIGLITTHDLALTGIAETLAPAAANIHFQDEVEDGRITFDYRIHPGVVRKSNAIALMRSVGLDV